MSTVIISRTRETGIDPGSRFAVFCRASRDRIVAAKLRYWHRRELSRLSDHLRRDIGLVNLGPDRARLLREFSDAHRAFPREHEIRLKPWNW